MIRRAPWVLLGLVAACGGDLPAGGEGAQTWWGNDLLLAGAELPGITADVPGDLMVAGGDIEFSGSTGRDYLGAGGRQRIGGTVGGNLRAAGGDLEVTSRVAGNATLAGGRIWLAPGASLEGNGYMAGGQVQVAGGVLGNLRLAGDEVVFEGGVDGDLSVDARRLRIGPAARIEGNLVYRVPPEAVEIAPGALIGGETIALAPRDAPRWALPFAFGWWALRILWALGFLLAGLVIVALLPGTFLRSSSALHERPGASTGAGVVWLIAVPAVGLVAALTLVGLPLAFVLLGVFLLLLYVARIVPAVWLGRLILKAEPDAGRGGVIVSFLLGGLILVIAGVIPFLGWLVGVVATVVGIGALLLALAGREAPPAPVRASAVAQDR